MNLGKESSKVPPRIFTTKYSNHAAKFEQFENSLCEDKQNREFSRISKSVPHNNLQLKCSSEHSQIVEEEEEVLTLGLIFRLDRASGNKF